MQQSNRPEDTVTSTSLCKKVEGAVFPLRLLVQAFEDGVDDPLDAAAGEEVALLLGAAAHFDKATLDHICGVQLAPQGPWKAEKGQLSVKGLVRCR
jgi:hypothetical protein